MRGSFGTVGGGQSSADLSLAGRSEPSRCVARCERIGEGDTREEHLTTFDVERGLETLEKAALSGEFSTQASLVFAPERGEIYFALKRDFSKVWKVSLADETIETYSGFGRARRMNLDSAGVTASELGKGSPGTLWRYVVVSGVILALAAGGCVLFAKNRRAQPG